MAQTFKERLVKARVKLIRSSPFFGTILLNAPVRETDHIPTAATDGHGLMFNPEFVKDLDEQQFNGLLLHELLHACLHHVPRMKDVFEVDPFVANLACDIVVNGIIDDNNLALPDGAVRDEKLKHLSVREVYTILKQKISKDKNYLGKKYGIKTINVCLQSPDGSGGQQGDKEQQGSGEGEEGQGLPGQGMDGPDWKDIMNQAATIARMKQAGPRGAAMERILSELLQPTIDWKTVLYKYITESRTDFSGYDRRFMYNNLYLDDFSGSEVNVLLFIDVSGSIDEQLLIDFNSEIHGAISAVDNVSGEVYCFDTRVHHVCPVSEISTSFRLIGGGGTCFREIFTTIATHREENPCKTILPIILTDGYADHDGLNHDPGDPLLWVICPGGVENHTLPFGDVARITR